MIGERPGQLTTLRKKSVTVGPHDIELYSFW